ALRGGRLRHLDGLGRSRGRERRRRAGRSRRGRRVGRGSAPRGSNLLAPALLAAGGPASELVEVLVVPAPELCPAHGARLRAGIDARLAARLPGEGAAADQLALAFLAACLAAPERVQRLALAAAELLAADSAGARAGVDRRLHAELVRGPRVEGRHVAPRLPQLAHGRGKV